MKWEQVRKTYPNQWIVFDILNEYEEDNHVIVTELAIIDTFDDLNQAYKYYCKLHKEDKNRKITLGDTKKDELVYKIERVGLLRW